MNPTLYLLLSLVLFGIGAIGVVLRKNTLFMLLNLELMMNAVGLALVAASLAGHLEGQLIVLMVLAVAASEVAIGIGILVNLVRLKNSPLVDLWNREEP